MRCHYYFVPARDRNFSVLNGCYKGKANRLVFVGKSYVCPGDSDYGGRRASPGAMAFNGSHSDVDGLNIEALRFVSHLVLRYHWLQLLNSASGPTSHGASHIGRWAFRG